jgi:uncharacterized delta-60 repeat protein
LLADGLPAGFYDLSFNGFGLNTTLIAGNDKVGAAALQLDGKIVVAGEVVKPDGSQVVALVRYLPNGQVDTGFGGPPQRGAAELDAGSMIDAVYAVAVDQNPGSPDDGDIVVAGRWTNSARQAELALARFKPDGSLDAGFGTAGGVVVDQRETNATGLALAIQRDDRIVVLGNSYSPSSGAIPFIERFNPAGTPDSSFGPGGLPVRPFGNGSPGAGGLALDPNGNIVLARVENASSSSTRVAVARLNTDGRPDPSFGSNGIARTTVEGSPVPINVQTLVIDPTGRIVVGGTAGSPTTRLPAPTGFWVARSTRSGNLDTSFNHGAVEVVNLQAAGLSLAGAKAVAVEPDGKIVLGGIASDSRGPLQEDIVLARLNPDGKLDESFGERGWDVPNIGSRVTGDLSSVLVQPDGNIVTAFTDVFPSLLNPSVLVSEFGVARFMGHVAVLPPNSGTLPAGVYRENFVTAANSGSPTLDSSDVFQHFLWYNLQPSLDMLHADRGHGWAIGHYPTAGKFALHEVASSAPVAALDTITFPNLRPDVRVGLASVDVSATEPARITFVGANGSYTVDVPAHAKQTVAAGESHALAGSPLNPSLELGPIREVILDSQDAFFYNLKVLVIPGGGPLDDSVTAPPGTMTTIDVLDFATGAAAAAGLQAPLELVAPPGQPNLPGSQTAISTTNANDIVYTNTLTAQPGQHPNDSFTYTVKDASGKTAMGTVYVTIDAPPHFDRVAIAPAPGVTPGHSSTGLRGWDVTHGTPGPLTGVIDLSDAEHDAIALTAAGGAGSVTLTQMSDYQYSFTYVPPTTYDYNPVTGVTGPVSAIFGDDQVVLHAKGTNSSTDFTVRLFSPGDLPPETAAISPNRDQERAQFVVPENTGRSYYGRDDVQPGYYSRALDSPGLVHFAAPGVLWNQVGPYYFQGRIFQLDPLRADLGFAPRHGHVYLFPDGSFNYTPKRGFTGPDFFGFYASDGYQRSELTVVDIHVAPGTTRQPFKNAPVLHDIHYQLNRSRDGADVFKPPVAHFSLLGADPELKTLIRPVHELSYVHQLYKFTILDLSATYGLGDYRRHHQNAFKDDLSLFYSDPALFLARSDFRGGPPEGGAALDSSKIKLGTVQPVVTLTYATPNSRGWLSNFAEVVVRVLSPAIELAQRAEISRAGSARLAAKQTMLPAQHDPRDHSAVGSFPAGLVHDVTRRAGGPLAWSAIPLRRRAARDRTARK